MKKFRMVSCGIVVGLLALSACGDDDDATDAVDTSTTSAGGAGTTSAGGAGTTAADGPETTSAGGEGPLTTAEPQAADEGMSPVKVGFHNIEGGTLSLPEIRQGFESGINYVNEELGGLNGHPVQIESCNTDLTPESAVNCANQFVEENVVVAIQGVDAAADAALPILKQAGIAEIALFAFTPGVNEAVGDAYVTLFSNEEVYAADLIQMQKLGGTKEAWLQTDTPGYRAAYEEVVKPIAEKLGLEVVPFFYPTPTDWTTFAATVLASDPDVVSFPAPQEGDTLAGVAAFRSAGFDGPIHAGSTNQLYAELDAETLENVVGHNEFYYNNFTSVPPQAAADIAVYERFINRDFPDFTSALYTQLGFHVAVTSMDMLRQVEGDVTAQSVYDTLPTVKGHKFFSEDTYDCSKPAWPGTTACSGGLVYTKPVEDLKEEILPDQPVDVSSVRPAG